MSECILQTTNPITSKHVNYSLKALLVTILNYSFLCNYKALSQFCYFNFNYNEREH